MKRISTLELIPGMTIAEDVLSFNRQLVMSKGTVLNDNLITRLDLYGILTVYVEDAPPPISVAPTTLDLNQTVSYKERVQNSPEFQKFKEDYERNLGSFKDAMNQMAERNLDLDVDGLLKDILGMVSIGSSWPGVLDMLQNMKDFDDSTFTHSMNVGLISNVLAKWLKLTPAQVEMATACGLFHDIGKLKIPHAIITKPGKLDAKEYAQIQRHPILGYQMLQQQKVDDHIRNAALMHHERSDGSGYPMRLSGNQIDPYARIVAIADIYDAMTAPRVYRGPLCPFRVIEMFEKEGFQKYDVEFLLIFLENVVNTYLQTPCRLNDNREGTIVFVNKEKLSRPTVQCGSNYVNLMNFPDLQIQDIL